MHSSDDKYVMDKIRSTLEEYQPQCSPNDWNKMAALLDRQPQPFKPTRGIEWFNGFICGILLSVFIIGSYIFFFNSNPSEKTQRTTNLTSFSENRSAEIKHEIDLKNESAPNSRRLSVIQSNVNYSSRFKPDESVILDPPIHGQNNYQQVSLNNLLDLPSNLDVQSNLNNDDNTFQPIAPIWIIYLRSIKQNSREKIALKQSNSKNYIHSDKRPAQSKSCLFNWDIFKLSFNMQDDLYKKFVGPDKIKISYSPELILGNFQTNAGISQGVGLLFEGQISNRISLGLGAYMRQYHWEKKNEFKTLVNGLPPDSTTMHYVVDSIHVNTGSWRYFEIPLEVRLHFIQNGKTQISINTFISAIILQSEKYQFDRIIGQTTLSQKLEVSPYSNYSILGSLKLGLEYRYRISERWNMFVEPYFKWYLKGMGETRYKPRSFGVNVGVVYQFNLHRKN